MKATVYTLKEICFEISSCLGICFNIMYKQLVFGLGYFDYLMIYFFALFMIFCILIFVVTFILIKFKL